MCVAQRILRVICRALSEWPLADRYSDSFAILHSLLHLTRSCWSSIFLNEEENIIESNANENRYPDEDRIPKHEEFMRMGIIEQKIKEQKIKKKSEMKINREFHIVLHWHLSRFHFLILNTCLLLILFRDFFRFFEIIFSSGLVNFSLVSVCRPRSWIKFDRLNPLLIGSQNLHNVFLAVSNLSQENYLFFML